MLKVNNLFKDYKSGSNVYNVLKNVSFNINEGEFVAIMGPSGSGKTTLLNCISSFTSFDKGEILFCEENISQLKEYEISEFRNKHLGFVFQDFMLLDGLTVFENICLPKIISGYGAKGINDKAYNLCETFGIENIRNKYPVEISGGEKQRTSIARALMNDPYVILADEPTGNLDSKSCRRVIESFLKAKKDLGATILMVTHDSFSASFCDRVIILRDGEIYKEISKTENRVDFMDKLLDVLKLLGGRDNGNE